MTTKFARRFACIVGIVTSRHATHAPPPASAIIREAWHAMVLDGHSARPLLAALVSDSPDALFDRIAVALHAAADAPGSLNRSAPEEREAIQGALAAIPNTAPFFFWGRRRVRRRTCTCLRLCHFAQEMLVGTV